MIEPQNAADGGVFSMNPMEAALVALYAWIGLAVLTYYGIRVYLRAHGEPAGWRFNPHGAYATLGHLSFYERGGGGHAVVFRSWKPFPLFWTVYRTDEPMSPELEIVKRGPVWRSIPWAFRWMENNAALSTLKSDGGADD